MQAIILAAGKGERLRPITDNVPKAMVSFLGKPLLWHTLEKLSRCGITTAVIVVGYKKEIILDYFGSQFEGIKITYVINDAYDTTNNIYSLWLAKDYLDRDTLLLECDIVFEEGMVRALLERKDENQLLVDAYKPWMEGTVVTVGDNGEIAGLISGAQQSKDFSFKNTFKTVNIYYFTGAFLARNFVPSLEFYVKSSKGTAYYEVVVGLLTYVGEKLLKATVNRHHVWYEIDDENDLRRAEFLFCSPSQQLALIKSNFGGLWNYNVFDFCYICNRYFPSSSLYAQLRLHLDKLIANYPSSQSSLDFLSGLIFKVPEGHSILTNGASQVIRLLDQMGEALGKILIAVPTFDEYINSISRRENIVFYQCETESFTLDADEFVAQCLQEGCKSAVLVNPNNPTGAFIELPKVAYLAGKLRESGVLLFLDESFMEFASADDAGSALPLIQNYENLVIIKSLGKVMGVPGLRLGIIATANSDVLGSIRRCIPIWNINSIAEDFLKQFLRYRKQFAQSCRQIMADRQEMYALLSALPHVKVYPSFANFFLIRLRDGVTSEDVENRLFCEHRIFIKNCTGRTGLGGGEYIRVALKTKHEDLFFLESFKKVLTAPKR